MPFVATITLLIALFAYHQIITWVPLFPFNNVRRHTIGDRFVESVITGGLLALAPAGFFLLHFWLMVAGLGFYVLLLVTEVMTWWVPYLFGTSPHMEAVYERTFKPTATILPARGRNPVPNVEHLLLHLLILAATVLSSLSLYWFVRG